MTHRPSRAQAAVLERAGGRTPTPLLRALGSRRIDARELRVGRDRRTGLGSAGTRVGRPRVTDPAAHTFSHRLWNQLWWRHFGEASSQARDEMRVYTFRDVQGALIGIAPMVLTRRPGLLPLVRQLQYFGADPNVTEIRGPICRPRDQYRVAEALRHRLLVESAQWDWLQWFGPLSSKLGQPLFEDDQFERAEPLEEFYLPLPDTWDAFRGTLIRNVKESIRRCYNSLKRDGLAHTFEVVTHPDDVGVALEIFFHLHAERALLADTVAHPDVFAGDVARRFLTDYAQALARRNQLRIFQMSIGGEVVATRLGFAFGDDLYRMAAL
jgi:hypothetical protein|nr:GNAT family N-acetyltransferase [Panacagrimonas sp.]